MLTFPWWWSWHIIHQEAQWNSVATFILKNKIQWNWMERSNMLQHRMYLIWTMSTHQVVGIFSSKSWHLPFHPPATYDVIDVSDSPHMVWSVSTAFSTAFFARMLINFSFQQVSQQLFTHVDQFFFSAGFSTALRTCRSILLSNRFLNSFADLSVNFSFLLVPLKLQASSYSPSFLYCDSDR